MRSLTSFSAIALALHLLAVLAGPLEELFAEDGLTFPPLFLAAGARGVFLAQGPEHLFLEGRDLLEKEPVRGDPAAPGGLADGGQVDGVDASEPDPPLRPAQQEEVPDRGVARQDVRFPLTRDEDPGEVDQFFISSRCRSA
jgi:hypothetical protein